VELQTLHSAKANKESTLRQSSQQQITVRYSTRQSTIHATVPMANFQKLRLLSAKANAMIKRRQPAVQTASIYFLQKQLCNHAFSSIKGISN